MGIELTQHKQQSAILKIKISSYPISIVVSSGLGRGGGAVYPG
jgi:hypothetical protein